MRLRIFLSVCFAVLLLVLFSFTNDLSSYSYGQISEVSGNKVSYLGDIRPFIDIKGCNAAQCHGSVGDEGGFELSLFNGDPKGDYERMIYANRGRYFDRFSPENSLFLRKINGKSPHKGGVLAEKGSKEYQMLVAWISQGAVYEYPNQRKIVSLRINPEKFQMKVGQEKQLSLMAVYSDGTEKDVTAEGYFTSNDMAVIAVGGDGGIRAGHFGQSCVSASYLRNTARVLVTVGNESRSNPQFNGNNKVDDLILAKWKQMGLEPSRLCSDEEFLRRVYLDVTGALPTVEQAKEFLADKAGNKRSELIEQLLASDKFADFQALKWCDLLRVKSEFPSNLWPNAVQAYQRWLRQSFIEDKPYDQFVRELLVSQGSDFRDSPVNFYRAFPDRQPQAIADTAALIFMGARMSCARCHEHPAESWGSRESLGMGAFFAKLGYKKTQEWKEEIVYFNPDGKLMHNGKIVQPQYIDGTMAEVKAGQDPREVFANWLTAKDNPWFAQNISNKIWFWLMGRGIIHQPDDIRPGNPATNPELLNYLVEELVGKDYDLKHLYRLILNSRTYQLSSEANANNKDDYAYFSHYMIKRLTAEQLLDAVGQVTGTNEPFTSRIPEPFTFIPDDCSAVQLADGSITTPFLEMFGRPGRDSSFESQRNNQAAMDQILHFINSEHLQKRLTSSSVLKKIVASKKNPKQIIDELYLAMLSRYPKADEVKILAEFFDKNKRNIAVEDTVWAIMNTKEFIFNH
ncbi:MAG: DUF1553 domain-containing protein [Phycisphaerae bacterium]|nr:DUF1553 domain-containing protein [Phycisphaerae bacterium]